MSASDEQRDEPGLADPRVAGDQHGRPIAGPSVAHRALELRELTGASNEHIAGPGFHLDQYPASAS